MDVSSVGAGARTSTRRPTPDGAPEDVCARLRDGVDVGGRHQGRAVQEPIEQGPHDGHLRPSSTRQSGLTARVTLTSYANQIDAGSYPASGATINTHLAAIEHLVHESNALGINAEPSRLVERTVGAHHTSHPWPKAPPEAAACGSPSRWRLRRDPLRSSRVGDVPVSP